MLKHQAASLCSFLLQLTCYVISNHPVNKLSSHMSSWIPWSLVCVLPLQIRQDPQELCPCQNEDRTYCRTWESTRVSSTSLGIVFDPFCLGRPAPIWQKCPKKSKLRKEGLILAHLASTLRKQRVSRDRVWSTRLQCPPPLTHFLCRGSTSWRFHGLSKQHHQIRTSCPNYLSLCRRFESDNNTWESVFLMGESVLAPEKWRNSESRLQAFP